MNRFVSILRWLLILPGAFLAGFIVTFPVHWIVQIYKFLPDSGDSAITNEYGESILHALQLQDLERIGYALVVPATGIYVASLIAPRARFIVAIGMASLIVFFITTALFLYPRPGVDFGAIPSWVMYCLWAISIVGALIKSYLDTKGETREQNLQQKYDTASPNSSIVAEDLSMNPILQVLNCLSSSMESIAVDHTGEAKRELSTLCEKLEKDSSFAIQENLEIANTLRQARAHLVSGDKQEGAQMLGQISRKLWAKVL
jgi:hypothetical protein